MSRIHIPAIDTATGATAEVYGQIRKAVSKVPNAYAALGALAPAALQAMLQADGALNAGTLSKQDREVVKLVISELAGCDYCVAAHSLMGKLAGIQPDALRQVRAGQPSGDARRDALVNFVRELAQHPGTVSDASFAAIRAAGFTDTQLAEIALAIAVITFTNVFNRINDTDVDFPRVD